MSALPPPLPAAPAEEGWERHWAQLKRWIDPRAAAATCLLLIAAALILTASGAERLREFYFAMNLNVNHRDLHELNSLGDIYLQDYLEQAPAPGTHECVIIGASIAATSYDIDPAARLHRLLEQQLIRLTREDWRVSNLATNGAVTWSNFYMARLLRRHRPPELLIAALDTVLPRDRNLHLLLNVGVQPGDLSPAEICPVAALNRQPLYIAEANCRRWLRRHSALFAGWNYASYSYPTRENVLAWLRFSRPWFTGGTPPPPSMPASYHADGTPKNWREVPANRARIEMYQRHGGHKQPWDGLMSGEYKQLFQELRRLQMQGTRVIVVSMPRNPALKHDLGPLPSCVKGLAQSYGLEFHDYWLSGLIPDEYYVDQGHFFGAGSAIMAAELARLVVPAPVEVH